MSGKINIKILGFFILIVLFKMCMIPAIALSFSGNDLVGTWYGTQLVTGDGPDDDPRWGYGSLVVGQNGNFTSIWNSPGKSNEVSTGIITIDSDGMIAINNASLIHGMINDNRNIIALVDGTPATGGNSMTTLFKRKTGVSFSTASLAGTWYGYRVISGDSPEDDPRWGYGYIVINGNGDFTATMNSPTAVNQVSSGNIQASSMGLISIDSNPLINGVINDSKDMIILVDGSSANTGNGMMIIEKRTSVNPFSVADLDGTWYGCQVVSGDGPDDDPRWGYGSFVIDGSGNFTAEWNSPTSSNEVSSGTIQVNGNGLISINSDPLVNGVISDNRHRIIFVSGNAEEQGNGLVIAFLRENAAPSYLPGVLQLLMN